MFGSFNHHTNPKKSCEIHWNPMKSLKACENSCRCYRSCTFHAINQVLHSDYSYMVAKKTKKKNTPCLLSNLLDPKQTPANKHRQASAKPPGLRFSAHSLRLLGPARRPLLGLWHRSTKAQQRAALSGGGVSNTGLQWCWEVPSRTLAQDQDVFWK